MVLVDTSIWIEHFRTHNPHLSDLLLRDAVVTHTFIVGELACARLGRRHALAAAVARLPRIRLVSEQEAIGLLDDPRLEDLPLGWIELNLLASCFLTSCWLWTKDTLLRPAAQRFALAYNPPLD